jgi:hypothetical protein
MVELGNSPLTDAQCNGFAQRCLFKTLDQLARRPGTPGSGRWVPCLTTPIPGIRHSVGASSRRLDTAEFTPTSFPRGADRSRPDLLAQVIELALQLRDTLRQPVDLRLQRVVLQARDVDTRLARALPPVGGAPLGQWKSEMKLWWEQHDYITVRPAASAARAPNSYTNAVLAIVTDNTDMAKRNVAASPMSIEQRINLMDVRLLDVFAQLEAIMRCARDVQRDLIRLRERRAAAEGVRAGSVTKIRKRIVSLSREAAALQPVVQGIADVVDDLRAATE